MSRLALMHVHEDTELDAERIIHQFSCQKNRRRAGIQPRVEAGVVTEPMLKTLQTLKYNMYTIYSITLSWLMTKKLQLMRSDTFI